MRTHPNQVRKAYRYTVLCSDGMDGTVSFSVFAVDWTEGLSKARAACEANGVEFIDMTCEEVSPNDQDHG